MPAGKYEKSFMSWKSVAHNRKSQNSLWLHVGEAAWQGLARNIGGLRVVLALTLMFGFIPPGLAETFQELIEEIIGNAGSSSQVALNTENINVRSSVRSATDYQYNISNNEATITKYIGPNGDVTIPDSIDGYLVTSIGNSAFRDRYGLTSVTIPTNVTNIGASAFMDCSGLTNMTIPPSVISIGEMAFCRCSKLNSLVIGDRVTSIGYAALSGCSGLTSVTIPDSVTSIGELVFYNCSGLTSIAVETANQLYSSLDGVLFDKNIRELIQFPPGKSGSYMIPTSVTSIGEWEFAHCTGLTSVTIPDSVTSIGDSAFYNCSGLTSVTIPNNVTSIGESTFYNCSGLTSVVIGNGIASIGNRAFYNCSSLTSLTIPDSVTSIGYEAFYDCSGLTSVVIGNGIASIGNFAFAECSLLSGIYFIGTPPAVGDYIFYGVSCKVYYIFGTAGWGIAFFGGLPTSVWTSEATFAGNGGTPSYATWNYNAGVAYGELPTASRPGYTFEGWWTALEESGTLVTVDTLVPLITTGHTLYAKWKGDYQYSISNNEATITKYIGPVGDVTIPDSIDGYPVTSIGYSAFYNFSGLTSVTIPTSVTSIGSGAFSGCYRLTSVTIPNGVISIGGYAFSDCSGLTSVTIPNSVTSIGQSAFTYCVGFTSVTIPMSVTSISDGAFSYCKGLTSVTIPTSVTSIGWGAFSNCSGLTNVTIPTSVTSIGQLAFSYCGGLTSVAIPNSVTSIGYGAFQYCSSLTGVVIPNSVTSIGDLAFAYCSLLSGIYFIGTPPAIGDSSFVGASGKVYYIAGTAGWGTEFLGGLPTAVWTSEVTFDGNGGTPSIVTQAFNVGNPYGELPTASRPDYYFAGWWTAIDDGILITVDSQVPALTNGYTLYAKWITYPQYQYHEISAGWNLISINLNLAEECRNLLLSKGAMVPDSSSKAYTLSGNLAASQACWIYCQEDDAFIVFGTALEEFDFKASLKPGWNFVGPLCDLSLAGTGAIAWAWNGHNLYPTDFLHAGHGYYLYWPGGYVAPP